WTGVGAKHKTRRHGRSCRRSQSASAASAERNGDRSDRCISQARKVSQVVGTRSYNLVPLRCTLSKFSRLPEQSKTPCELFDRCLLGCLVSGPGKIGTQYLE